MPRRAAVPLVWLSIAAPFLALPGLPRGLLAQDWDAPEVSALVARAIARRQAAFADTALKDFSARAHGFVFFLGQIGEGFSEPPRLIKADQLELQVYWQAPNFSKQIIIGWRDRKDLPTDIAYHRDHLGIALNNFPDRIRLGEGDEVRDVPHPLAPNGPSLYRYALRDSLMIALPDRAIRVYEIAVRPRDFRAPRLVGSIFLDVDRSDMVRMAFEFTRPAYLDPELEDITVAIENSLWAGRYWLPYRQEIAIRRRGTWLDFPVRGIIQGRWEIDRYAINQGVDSGLVRMPGPEIVAQAPETRDSFPWGDSLGADIRDVAQSPRLEDFAAVRAQVLEVAMGHAIDGLQRTQLGGASLSDFAHYNRVEGLALGVGATVRGGNDATVLRVRGGAATATTLFTGGAELSARHGAWTWRLAGERAVRDLGDVPVISGVVNSLSAQETGADFGDYFLATGGQGSVTLALSGRTSVQLGAGWERIGSLATHAGWARGSFARPNPSVGAGDWSRLRLVLRRLAPSFTTVRNLSGKVEIEGGAGTSAYLRGYGELRWQVPVWSGWLVARASGGAGTRDLPAHHAFVMGGRGTLLGEGFRAYAGRASGWGSLDLRLPLGVPELPLGSFAGTGRTLTVIPFVAAGWVGEAVTLPLGAPARGLRPVVGLGLEWFHDLIRLDAGYGLRTGKVGVAVDVSRDFWDIL
jgi:hypothetical protein